MKSSYSGLVDSIGPLRRIANTTVINMIISALTTIYIFSYALEDTSKSKHIPHPKDQDDRTEETNKDKDTDQKKPQKIHHFKLLPKDTNLLNQALYIDIPLIVHYPDTMAKSLRVLDWIVPKRCKSVMLKGLSSLYGINHTPRQTLKDNVTL